MSESQNRLGELPRAGSQALRRVVLGYVVVLCATAVAGLMWSAIEFVQLLPELLTDSSLWNREYGGSTMGFGRWIAILSLWVAAPLFGGLLALVVALALALSIRDREDATWLAVVFAVPTVYYVSEWVLPTPEMFIESAVGHSWVVSLPYPWAQLLIGPGIVLLPIALLRLSVLFPQHHGHHRADSDQGGVLQRVTQLSRYLALGRAPALFWVVPLATLGFLDTNSVTLGLPAQLVAWLWLTTFTAAFVINLRVAWGSAVGVGRRRIAWLLGLLGFVFVLSPLGIWAFESWRSGSIQFVSLVVSGAVFSLPPLIFAFLAFAAVYVAGAVDPRLAIRRGTLYGSLGSLFIFIFAGVATLAEGLLESYLGLPRTVGAMLTGGTIALVLFPVKRRLDGIIDHVLPATAFAEGRTDTVAIVFSDIVGYTRLTGEDEKAALTLLSLFYKAARRLAGQNGGRVVNTVADEVVLEFKAAKSALEAATELQRELRQGAQRLDLQLPELCTGIHYGEVTRRNDGNLFGDTMNLASRVQGVAEPGQVVFSQAVADQVGGVAGTEDLGERTLKNVSGPIRCYAVSATGD